jgi:hypothetical protein
MSGFDEKIQEDGTHFLAIIGDLRASRSAPERAETQRLLEEALARVSREEKERLAARFVVTLGDEFQGLLRGAGATMRVLLALEGALDGIPVRYGVGWGTLSTPLKEEALGMDGPCFHRARGAVDRGKQEDRWVTVWGFGADDEIVNGILSLMAAVRGEWTDIQAETVAETRRAATQRDVAAARGRSESTVSKALKAANYDQMLEAERAVTAILVRHDTARNAQGTSGEESPE